MKKTLRTLALAALTMLSALSYNSASASQLDNSAQSGQAKYIFYFIGDGMATSQVRLAEAALTADEFQANYAELTGSEGNIEALNIRSINVTGLATTNAQNRYITCSAAAATALATGNKTNVGIISETADGQKLRTIAEMASDKGMKVGIVSSVSIDHATPAGFYAHTSSRNNYKEIGDQLLDTGFDYFAGGSVRWNSRARAEDTDNATAYATYRAAAEQKGFKYVATKDEFDALESGSGPVIATLNMLAEKQYTGDGSAMPFTIDLAQEAEDDRISLAQFTAKGAELLENPNGFFMMVEGGKIDWACHANDAATTAYEVVAFDEAIGVALDFAARYPEETLIVITGDHDCGGLTIGFAGTGYESAFDILAASRVSYNVFGQNVTAKMKAGASFEELLDYACENFGFTNDVTDGSDGVITQTAELSNFEVELLRAAHKKSLVKIDDYYAKFDEVDEYSSSYGGYDPFTTTCTSIINNKSGIDFTSYSHTAVPVMVFAHGACEGLFNGYYDNTDIAKKIMQAAGLE